MDKGKKMRVVMAGISRPTTYRQAVERVVTARRIVEGKDAHDWRENALRG